jgi:small subunit ribosomal protein S2
MNELQNTLINYEEMLKSGMHFGRKKTVYNPKMGDFVFSVRDGICIIDLLKTQEKLNIAISSLRKVMEAGGTVLFVAPTKQSTESTKALAEALGMPYVLDRWLGGTLTNFKVHSARVRKLEEMEKQLTTGELDKYTKKERLMFERELKKMQTKFGGLKKLSKLPDVVFISSLKEGALVVNEAKITGVKVISIANTDSDPTSISQVIPANDRSKKSVDLIIQTMQTELVNTVK